MEMLESYYVDDISGSLCVRICSLAVAVVRWHATTMPDTVCDLWNDDNNNSNSTSCTAWRMRTTLSLYLSPVPIRTYYLLQVQIILCDDDEHSASGIDEQEKRKSRCVTGETRTILFSISELKRAQNGRNYSYTPNHGNYLPHPPFVVNNQIFDSSTAFYHDKVLRSFSFTRVLFI